MMTQNPMGLASVRKRRRQSIPKPLPYTSNTTNASNISNHSNATLHNSSGPIITEDLLLQMQYRLPSACKSLGIKVVTEARKGLSRVLTPTHKDIELFANQLKTSDFRAVEPNWNTLEDRIPCFAISYVQHPLRGRFKCSNKQWQNFHRVVEAIAHAGVTQFRVWLDQCLWIRDASQANWVHIGILPYVIWPVISLGVKLPGCERTVGSFVRMWPFVEEVSALWGMGLIIASEYRSHDQTSGVRPWLSCNSRLRTEPDQDLLILLLNIFHGAADAHKTGWEDDVRELKGMAHANIMYANENLIVGSDWKDRFASVKPSLSYNVIRKIKMPIASKEYGGVNIYLDGSRALKVTGWDGVREWLSGNEEVIPASTHGRKRIRIDETKYNLVTDVGNFRLLNLGGVTYALWLLVAMYGESAHFSRGRVSWTKIVSGRGSCSLAEMFRNENKYGIQRVLRKELQKPALRLLCAEQVKMTIEWM